MNPSPPPSPTPDDRLSQRQAQFVFWFNGLFPILTSIVTPLTVYRKVLKKPHASDIQRYNDLLQEVSRQLVSGTIGLISYFSGGALTRGIINLLPNQKNNPPDANDQHVKMIVGGSVLSFIGYSFVRPSIATDILYLLRKNETHGPKTEQPTAGKPLSKWQKRLDQWVDKQLFKAGKPQLKKTALLSFGVLGGYLSALAFGIYGLSRLFSSPPPSSSNPPAKAPLKPTPANALPVNIPGSVPYITRYQAPSPPAVYKSPI